MKPKVLVIMGPTGVGKTKLSIELAQRFNGECISCDSVAVYKDLDIGSAKPLEKERGLVVHHGIDIMNIYEKMDVATFQQYARDKIQEVTEKGKLPILVGGTGFYLKALLKDYKFSEVKENSENSKEKLSNEELYKLLKEIDPVQAEKIHVNNRQRLLSYFHIYDQTNVTRTENIISQHKQWLYDCKFYYLTVERELLIKRIDDRVERMIQDGLVEEVKRVSEDGKLLHLPAFNAIGYREFVEYFQGNQTLEETIQLIKVHTRQYSKRQLTWFKHQMEGEVVDTTSPEFIEKIEEEVREWISMND